MAFSNQEAKISNQEAKISKLFLIDFAPFLAGGMSQAALLQTTLKTTNHGALAI